MRIRIEIEAATSPSFDLTNADNLDSLIEQVADLANYTISHRSLDGLISARYIGPAKEPVK